MIYEWSRFNFRLEHNDWVDTLAIRLLRSMGGVVSVTLEVRITISCDVS